jgi:hypothetical protein
MVCRVEGSGLFNSNSMSVVQTGREFITISGRILPDNALVSYLIWKYYRANYRHALKDEDIIEFGK